MRTFSGKAHYGGDIGTGALFALISAARPPNRGKSAMDDDIGSVADGDNLEVFGVDAKRVVLVAVVGFG